jgi:Gene product 88
MKLLKFSTGNGKLKNRLIFSLPSGYSCPHAGVCKTFADRATGTITDLPQHTGTTADEFRCFAVMAETRPNVREARWHNWDLIRETMYSNGNQVTLLTNLIETSLLMYPPKELVRVHEAGDFWTEYYMKAWLIAARHRPNQKFYAYTKSLGMWLNLADQIPNNFYLTASCGGTLDYLIPKHPNVFQRVAYVVYTEEEATERGLEIDHDDSHCFGDKPFALLVHGSQRAGSDASKAISQRKKEGKFVGYGKTNVK